MTFKGTTLKKLSAMFSVLAILYLAGCGGGGGAKTSNSIPSKANTGSITVSMATVSVAKSAARSANAATIRDYTGYSYRLSASGMDDITGTVSANTFTVSGVAPGKNILLEVFKDKVKLKAYIPEVVAGKTHARSCDIDTTAAAIVWEGLGGSAGKESVRSISDLEDEADDATSDVYAVVTALNTALDTAVNSPTSITGSDMLTSTGVTTAVTTATTAIAADETAPTILLVTPNDNTIEQDTTDTSIVIVFSEAMDTTVPTGITVSVEDVTAQTAAVSVTNSAISWGANLRTLTINYGVALNYDSDYKVIVTLDPTELKDAAGNALSLASVNATTVDTTAKTITVEFSTIYQVTAWTEATKTIHESADMGDFDLTFVDSYVDDDETDLGTIVASGATYSGTAACSTCHSSIYSTFVKTNHATAMVRKGEELAKGEGHFSARCLYCHTVDGPQVPDYTAGSDSPARSLSAGAWGLTPTDYSAYTTDEIVLFATNSAMAGIQCENCHGPASKHVAANHVDGDTVDDIVGPDQAVSASVCAVCHDAPTHHMKIQNWRKSLHAASLDGTHMGGSNSCAPCHSAEGFIALVERQETDSSAVPWDGLTRNGIAGGTDVSFATRNAYSNVSCVACHDPHDAHEDEGAGQLRKPVSELCATCHSGRLKVPGPGNYRGPHHNTQARVLNGYGIINPDGKMLWEAAGYLCSDVTTGIGIEATALTECDTTKDYIETIATTLDKTMGETECVECHMYDGDHTMSPTEEACQACHAGMDASAVVGQIQSKSNYLISKLQTRFDVMKTDAVLVSNKPSAWDAGTATYTQYFLIDWNLKWLQYDGGLGMHNREMQELGYDYTDEMLTDYGY